MQRAWGIPSDLTSVVSARLSLQVTAICWFGRCSDNGIHFESEGNYVHLDTANPFTTLGSFFRHLLVDLIYGNTGTYIILPN